MRVATGQENSTYRKERKKREKGKKRETDRQSWEKLVSLNQKAVTVKCLITLTERLVIYNQVL